MKSFLQIAVNDEETSEMEDILQHFNEINLQLKDKMLKEKQKKYLNVYQ